MAHQDPQIWALIIAAILSLRPRLDLHLGRPHKRDEDATPEDGGDATD